MYRGTKERGRRHGVAIIVGPRLSQYIQEVKLINEQLMRCTIRVEGRRYNIYQVYAPQQGCAEEEKEQFLDTMEEEYRIPGDDDTGLLIGDFNARVGKERKGIENIIGTFGEETKNSER